MGQRLGQVMPMPESVMKIHSVDDYTNERFLTYCDTVKLKWCLWPRRCAANNSWIWLRPAYLATYVIRGPGDRAVWTRWYSATEYLILQLKGYEIDDFYN
jgi:hypothetical protein